MSNLGKKGVVQATGNNSTRFREGIREGGGGGPGGKISEKMSWLNQFVLVNQNI